MKVISLPAFVLSFMLHVASFGQSASDSLAQKTTQKPTRTTSTATAPAPAQETVAPKITGANTLARQFYSIKDKSNSYQEYKVIKESNLNAFWKNVQDSMSVTKKQLQDVQAKIDGQQAELAKLKQAVNDREEKLQKNAYNTARINVFGIDMLKENYIYINLAIISTLLLTVGVAIFKYRSSNKLAIAKVSEFESVKSELNGYKQRLRERETIMGRELQTERNKVEELNQLIASLKKKVH